MQEKRLDAQIQVAVKALYLGLALEKSDELQLWNDCRGLWQEPLDHERLRLAAETVMKPANPEVAPGRGSGSW
jgi:hypothetical protein